MYVYIGGVDRSEQVQFDSLNIEDEQQDRTKKMEFTLIAPPLPADYAEVRAFMGFPILSATSNTVTLNISYFANNQGMYRVGELFYVRVNTSNENYGIITGIDNNAGKLRITVSANWASTPTAGQVGGTLRFAGNAIDRADENETILQNITYKVSCVGYSRIFDKELINDSFQNRDARYIINDFCNTTINLNDEINPMEYVDNTAAAADWVLAAPALAPTIDTSDYREGTRSCSFSWTHTGSAPRWRCNGTTRDDSAYTGVASGQPTKGVLGFWYKCANFTAITSMEIQYGSDLGANMIRCFITPTSNNWTYAELALKDGILSGTPNWLLASVIRIIINETSASSVKFDGFRLLEDKFIHHYPFVQETSLLDNFNVSRLKPTEVMQRLADTFAWSWYIDNERKIHFFSQETNTAPFSITETSNNFNNLAISYDLSRLVNKQVVEGGEETGTVLYSEVKEGNGTQREWITKNKFKGLLISVDKNTSTLTATTGTTTTSVTTTAPHGLAVGDYITNRTRSNAVRRVLTTPTTTSYTVDAVTGQVSGDTLSKFVAQTVGVEGINTDAGYNYMSNYNQKSIRDSSAEVTLTAGQFLLFKYYEVVPVIVQRFSADSIASMKSVLGYTNGIFEGQKITDRTIQSSFEAAAFADAILDKYSNVVITATFETDYDGLKAGMLIHLKDTANGTRNIDRDFLVQTVSAQRIDRWSTFRYKVTCSTLLFGMVELLTQMLRIGRNIDVDADAVVSNLLDGLEQLSIVDGSSYTVVAVPFKYAPSSNNGIYNLSSYV